MRTERIYYLVSILNEFALEVPYLAYYIFQTLGLGYAYLYMAISALVFGLLDYPTGGIADRIGRKSTFAFGIFLVGNQLFTFSLLCSPTHNSFSGPILWVRKRLTKRFL